MLVHVDVRFHYQLLLHNARNPFQGEKRVRHVIQDAEKENQVEDTNLLRADVEDVQLDRFDFRAKCLVSEFESFLAGMETSQAGLSSATTRLAREPFALVREEAVPRADIEDREVL